MNNVRGGGPRGEKTFSGQDRKYRFRRLTGLTVTEINAKTRRKPAPGLAGTKPTGSSVNICQSGGDPECSVEAASQFGFQLCMRSDRKLRGLVNFSN